MLIQIKVNVWVCTREVIYSLRNSSGLWLIKDFKIEKSNPACNNCMSPARHITPHHLTIKQLETPAFFVEDCRSCFLFSPKNIWMFHEDIRCYVGCKECGNCIVVCNPTGTENETSAWLSSEQPFIQSKHCYLKLSESNTDIFRYTLQIVCIL